MAKMIWIVSFFVISHAQAVPAPAVSLEILGGIYPKDLVPAECADITKGVKCQKTPFGKFHMVGQNQDGLFYSKTTFTDPEGVEIVEQSWTKDNHIQKGSIINKQLGIETHLDVQGGKVKYSLIKEGQVKTSEDDLEDNLVMPSTLIAYLRSRFQQIEEGKSIKIKMAVLDRLDSYTFVIKKIREEKSAKGVPLYVLEMSPNSFFVSTLVKPLYFYIELPTLRLVAFEGRSSLRRKIDGKYKEMDAKVWYEQIVDTFRPNVASNACSEDALKKDSKCVINPEVPHVNSSTKK